MDRATAQMRVAVLPKSVAKEKKDLRILETVKTLEGKKQLYVLALVQSATFGGIPTVQSVTLRIPSRL